MTFQMAFGFLLIALALFWVGLLLWTQPRSTQPRSTQSRSTQTRPSSPRPTPPRQARPSSTPEPRIPVKPIPTQGEEQLWREKLLTITRGNVGAIERGVAAKRQRFPQLSDAELLKLLYEEYLRDRR